MLEITILGQPFSKANSRKIVRFGSRMASIKSDKARSYEESAIGQVSSQMDGKEPLEVPVQVIIGIYYPDRRQDLDESIILDVLQKRVDKRSGIVLSKGAYLNDRQVVSKVVTRHIDKQNPRAEIIIIQA